MGDDDGPFALRHGTGTEPEWKGWTGDGGGLCADPHRGDSPAPVRRARLDLLGEQDSRGLRCSGQGRGSRHTILRQGEGGGGGGSLGGGGPLLKCQELRVLYEELPPGVARTPGGRPLGAVGGHVELVDGVAREGLPEFLFCEAEVRDSPVSGAHHEVVPVPPPGEVQDGVAEEVVHHHERTLEVGEPHGEGAVATADGYAAVIVRGGFLLPVEVRAEGDDLDGLPVTHKVHPRLPPRPLDDVRRGAVVVERVGGHHVPAVGGPAQSEHVGRPPALLERLGDELLFLPVARPPEAQRPVVGLGGDVLPHGVPRDALHEAAVTRDDRVLVGELGRVPDDDGVVDAGGG